jgi:predicted TIM-barrel fold metal-dependent hydrolase
VGARVNRRAFLAASAGALVAGCDLSWREGLFNSCRAELPSGLAANPIVTGAWSGLDPANVWDVHCHIFGNGDSGAGPWFNPAMENLLRPQQYVQRLFYMNAGCVHDSPGQVDASVVDRLRNQCAMLPVGAKVLLLAFDWARDDAGSPLRERSTFYVPDAYAATVAARDPGRFEWAASVHPHAKDALARLDWAAANGARAVKWLPSAQGIDPASPRCAAFYRQLGALQLPLISHAGDERAVRGHDEALGNPLRLRRALDAGVRVVVAHCGSLGAGRDLDRGDAAPLVSNFSLFARLMDSPAHVGRVFGDISAITQGNRIDVLASIVERSDWHSRLLNGSDYPLPGILPLISPDLLVSRGMLAPGAVAALREIREHNALLFDFVLKRSVVSNGARLASSVFETRSFFTNPA